MRQKHTLQRVFVDGPALGIPGGRRTVRRVVGKLSLPPALQAAGVPSPLYVQIKVGPAPKDIIVVEVPGSPDPTDGSRLYAATQVVDYETFYEDLARKYHVDVAERQV